MIITLQELRDQIGKPTEDGSEYGNIQDDELTSIIDRWTNVFDQTIDQRIREHVQKGIPLLDESMMDEVEIPLSAFANSNLDVLKKGTIDAAYYPYTTLPGFDDDYFYAYDKNIELTSSTSWVERRRFGFRDSQIIVIPNDATEITVFLPRLSDVKDVLGADLYDDINNSIIREAERFMDRTIKEGARQEFDELTLGTPSE